MDSEDDAFESPLRSKKRKIGNRGRDESPQPRVQRNGGAQTRSSASGRTGDWWEWNDDAAEGQSLEPSAFEDKQRVKKNVMAAASGVHGGQRAPLTPCGSASQVPERAQRSSAGPDARAGGEVTLGSARRRPLTSIAADRPFADHQRVCSTVGRSGRAPTQLFDSTLESPCIRTTGGLRHKRGGEASQQLLNGAENAATTDTGRDGQVIKHNNNIRADDSELTSQTRPAIVTTNPYCRTRGALSAAQESSFEHQMACVSGPGVHTAGVGTALRDEGCPVCGCNLSIVSDTELGRLAHVNSCLDLHTENAPGGRGLVAGRRVSCAEDGNGGPEQTGGAVERWCAPNSRIAAYNASGGTATV